jgi:hypothetical protein
MVTSSPPVFRPDLPLTTLPAATDKIALIWAAQPEFIEIIFAINLLGGTGVPAAARIWLPSTRA